MWTRMSISSPTTTCKSCRKDKVMKGGYRNDSGEVSLSDIQRTRRDMIRYALMMTLESSTTFRGAH